jgi:ribosomal protein S18 acetylase RimI-like enzyme
MDMIEYTNSVQNITIDMLKGFFTEWNTPQTPEHHLKILENNSYIVLALDTDTKCAVGFITALTDNVQAAFISMLEVLPSYQNNGIGSQLVIKMLDQLKDVPTVDLMCNTDKQEFYSKFGMKPSVGMVLRKN